jgi:hypothetical protein
MRRPRGGSGNVHFKLAADRSSEQQRLIEFIYHYGSAGPWTCLELPQRLVENPHRLRNGEFMASIGHLERANLLH